MTEVYSVTRYKSGESEPINVCKVDTTRALDTSDQSPAKNQGGHIIMEGNNTVVRRLTPIECERLQGFPDNYTNIPWRNKPIAPDSRRYKALGNSMAVPVMWWIGKRIHESQPVVYNEEAIRNAMIKPLSQEEKETGQQLLF